MTLSQRIDNTVAKIQDINWAMQNPYAGNAPRTNELIEQSLRKELGEKRSYLRKLQRRAGLIPA